jgi:hypothetical protein
MGQKEEGEREREQLIACAMIEHALPRYATGEKMAPVCHPSVTLLVDGEQWRCVRRHARPGAALPHASPYLPHAISLLALSVSAVSRRLRQMDWRAGIRRRTTDRSCLMRDTR